MAFARVARFLASRKDFKEDKDQHATNLRLLEAYLEEAKDWYPMLVKDAPPNAADMPAGTSAFVAYSQGVYVWRASQKDWVWLPFANVENTFTKRQDIYVDDDNAILALRRVNVATTPAASDIVGRVLFQGEDDSGVNWTYGEVRGYIVDPSAASPDGGVDILVLSNPSLFRAARFTHDGTRAYWAFGNDLDTFLLCGSGSPEGVVAAGPGSQYFQVNGVSGTMRWRKVSGTGTAGWSPDFLTAAPAWNPPSVADGAFTATDITVTGAVVGDVCHVGTTATLPDGVFLSSRVSAADTVRVTLHNESGAVQDLGSATYKVYVWK